MVEGDDMKLKIYESEHEVNEKTSLVAMRRACPTFFKVKHGERETYDVYRGCLIVRNTVRFAGLTKRMTAVYIFLVDQGDLFCVSACEELGSVTDAKRYIDELFEHGHYEYGWRRSLSN